jgi:hypothetical protein
MIPKKAKPNHDKEKQNAYEWCLVSGNRLKSARPLLFKCLFNSRTDSEQSFLHAHEAPNSEYESTFLTSFRFGHALSKDRTAVLTKFEYSSLQITT